MLNLNILSTILEKIPGKQQWNTSVVNPPEQEPTPEQGPSYKYACLLFLSQLN